MKVPFDFKKPNIETAWLLGFIFSDATIGDHMDRRVIRLYNVSKELLEAVKTKYNIPYKVIPHKNKNNILYYIRFSDPDFVQSVEAYGFSGDKTNLKVPEMNMDCTKSFVSGYLTGKGSFFEEKQSSNYGVKVIYRSKIFIEDLAKYIAVCCDVRIPNPHCRLIKNEVSCQLKYTGADCDKIKAFMKSHVVMTDFEFPQLK